MCTLILIPQESAAQQVQFNESESTVATKKLTHIPSVGVSWQSTIF